MASYILVIDIGNTSTSLGLYRRNKITHNERIATAAQGERDFARAVRRVIGKEPIDGAVLCSVVPEKSSRWTRIVEDTACVRVLRMNHRFNLGVKITYPRPTTIGEDRLANACGAVGRYGVPIVVADFGTALTFDAISRTKGYMGGIIAPGLPLMFDYLADKTSLLPHIDADSIQHAIGKNTTEAMRLGARYGYRGMVREIIGHLQRHFANGAFTLCVTGGYAQWVLRGFSIPVKYDPLLTLYGLARFYELNRDENTNR